MPELPDILAYRHALASRIVGQPIERARAFSPFVVRSVAPPVAAAASRRVEEVGRLGKRLVLHLEGDHHLVIHLMIAGRLRWGPRKEGARPMGKIALAAFDFPNGTLTLTEASPKKRASIHLVAGREALLEHDRGGLDVRSAPLDAFREALTAENRTLKRALANPACFDGIGNAYSDEILHAARLSPLRLTRSLKPEEVARLHAAARGVLELWIERLCARFDTKFPGPGDITAFRPEFAAHGRFGEPCPVCGKPIQRIRYAENETNYCAVCQNEGRLLADRALSRLLKEDWPRTLEELEGE
jgi:formamidopyrimidine-DNA glycosylase